MINMLTRICVVLIICIAATGCATSGYFVDRMNDASDIFTAQIGYGGGAKARVGPVQIGLLADIGLGGLRGGELLGKDDFWPAGNDQPVKQDYVALLAGLERFQGNMDSNKRGKSFASTQKVLSLPVNFEKDPELSNYAKRNNMVYNPWPYYTQLELVVGLGLNLRLGFNLGEFVDFLLGWTALDILNDDLKSTGQ